MPEARPKSAATVATNRSQSPTCHPAHPGQGDLFARVRVPRRRYLPVLTSPPLPPPGVRHDNPETCFAAAAAVMPVLELQRSLILGWVEGRGWLGGNASEVDDGMTFPAGTAGRRLGELARDNDLVRTQAQRRTASGCWGYVFIGHRAYFEFGLATITERLLRDPEARRGRDPALGVPANSGSPDAIREG